MFPHPLVLSYGMGVDSTAMLVGLHQHGERPDLILFADTGSEKAETYAYLDTINEWLDRTGFPCVTVVRYTPKRFKHGKYDSLAGNCFQNATLPSLAFGMKGCSLKWKVAPMDKFVASWQPALDAWAAGRKVQRAIGYDCSAADSKRFAHAISKTADPKYEYVYPLRDWGWDRARCVREIEAAGLPVPAKSACFFCPAMKAHELHGLPASQLKQIVIMETRAKPHLRNVEGLWRKATAKRPGAMTDYIRGRLLPEAEVERLKRETPMGRGNPQLDDFLEKEAA